MEKLIYATIWLVAIWVSIKALRNVLSLPRQIPDRADRVVSLIFGALAIALPIATVLFVSTSNNLGWFWPLVLLSTAGLACLSLTAAKGLPLTTAR